MKGFFEFIEPWVFDNYVIIMIMIMITMMIIIVRLLSFLLLWIVNPYYVYVVTVIVKYLSIEAKYKLITLLKNWIIG